MWKKKQFPNLMFLVSTIFFHQLPSTILLPIKRNETKMNTLKSLQTITEFTFLIPSIYVTVITFKLKVFLSLCLLVWIRGSWVVLISVSLQGSEGFTLNYKGITSTMSLSKVSFRVLSWILFIYKTYTSSRTK